MLGPEETFGAPAWGFDRRCAPPFTGASFSSTTFPVITTSALALSANASVARATNRREVTQSSSADFDSNWSHPSLAAWVVELPWAALRAPPGCRREATTRAMRDIGEELRQSCCPAPPQPFGRAGFGPLASLLVVADDPRRLPPRASLSNQIVPARPHASSTTGC